MARLILVEDHDDLRDATAAALRALGHDVQSLADGSTLDAVAAEFEPEALVLDLQLPGEDGLAIARRVRQTHAGWGIVMLTARTLAQQRAVGYASGADIYLTKPCSVWEVDAAVKAVLRRLHPTQTSQTELVLHIASLRLQGPLASVDVSDTECALLMAFTKAAARQLENWQIMEVSGKPEQQVNKSALEVVLSRLRRKLVQAGAAEPALRVIRGEGYQLGVAITLRRGT